MATSMPPAQSPYHMLPYPTSATKVAAGASSMSMPGITASRHGSSTPAGSALSASAIRGTPIRSTRLEVPPVSVAGRRSLAVRCAADSRGSAGDGMDGAQVSAAKPSGGDMMKLFNDAQQNMLYLNKQRLIALDQLHKSEQDREYLAARVAQAEAEAAAAAAEREVMEERVRAAEAAIRAAEGRGASRGKPSSSSSSSAAAAAAASGSVRPDPPSLWSQLLLRADSLLLSKAISEGQARALRALAANRDAVSGEVYEGVRGMSDEDVRGPLLKLLEGNRRFLHVVHLATELAPVAQEGSLATWMAGLCRAMRRKGHLVEVVLPMHACADTSAVDDFRELPGELSSFFDGKWHRSKVFTGTVFGLPVTFIQPLHPGKFFNRDRLYDYEDDFERFSFFTCASLEYLCRQGKQPDVIHLHNWHTAVAAPLFWEIYHKQGMLKTRILFTCHDARCQNIQPASKLSLIGLDPSQLNRPDRLQDNRDQSKINLLKGGIVYSNKVTTVSPVYSKDIRTPQHGCNLDATIGIHSQKFVGLPSGLDLLSWDPLVDRFLPVPLDAREDPLGGKAVARSELRRRVGLPVIDKGTGEERKLVALVIPQVVEADLELVTSAVTCALAYQAQIVVVTGCRSPKVQLALEEMQRGQQDPNARMEILFDDSLAHLAVASAHVLLCSAERDPSGQMPLVGARYGALPVARQLQGAVESLVDVDDPRRGQSEGVGFFFANDKPADAIATLSRALMTLKSDPRRWESIVQTAMSANTSWDGQSSDAYIEAYWSIRQG